MPTKMKPKADQLYTCLWSFAGDNLSVAQGQRFRGDNPIVQRFPDRFVSSDTPDDELARLRAEALAEALSPPAPAPLGRVKLRVKAGVGDNRDQVVWHGTARHGVGEEFVAEGSDAQYLLDSGACELVRTLRRKGRAEPEAIGAAGNFATGREAD